MFSFSKVAPFLFSFCLSSLFADIKSTSGEINFYRDINNSTEARLTADGFSLGDFNPSANLHVKGNVILESGNVWLGNSYKKSSIEFGGTIGQSFGTISTDTILSSQDLHSLYFIDTSSDNINLTLPSAGNVTGRQYQFKKMSANNHVRILSSEMIEGTDSQLDMSNPSNGLSNVKLMSDGSAWYVLDRSDDVYTLVGADNLVGWWRLDETSGTTAFDSSGQSNHGTIGGSGITFSANNIRGPIQGALNMSTLNNYIDVTSFNGLPSNQITVSCWAFVTQNQNWNRYINHEWVNDGWLLYSGINGDLRFGIGQSGVQYNAIAPNHTILLNQWCFFTGTYDGNELKIFINGSELDSTALVGASMDNIGAVDISKSSSVNGMLDDVRIYSRALTQSEILHLYREGLN